MTSQSTDQLFDLTGKAILVTGATGYLGCSMATAMAKAGAIVLINGRSESRCNALTRQLREEGLEARSAPFNVTNELEISSFFETLGGKALHGLVNNAFSGPGGSFETVEPSIYSEAFDVTVIAAHRLIRAALPNLRQAVKEGSAASVLNILSMYGTVSPVHELYESPVETNPPSYGAAKAALGQLTRYGACEFGREGIRVNAIAPGPFPSTEVQNKSPDFIARLEARVPMKRIGAPDEIAGPTLFMMSDASSYVNGATLPVDGGWTSW